MSTEHDLVINLSVFWLIIFQNFPRGNRNKIP